MYLVGGTMGEYSTFNNMSSVIDDVKLPDTTHLGSSGKSIGVAPQQNSYKLDVNAINQFINSTTDRAVLERIAKASQEALLKETFKEYITPLLEILGAVQKYQGRAIGVIYFDEQSVRITSGMEEYVNSGIYKDSTGNKIISYGEAESFLRFLGAYGQEDAPPEVAGD